MTRVLSRQDLRNVIKIYINYDSDEVKELLTDPTKLDDSELVSSIINFTGIYDNPYLKLMEFYEKYMLYEGGKKKGKKKKSKKKSKKGKKKSKKGKKKSKKGKKKSKKLSEKKK